MNIAPYRTGFLTSSIYYNNQAKRNNFGHFKNIPPDTVSFGQNKDITEILKNHNSVVDVVFSDIDGTIANNGIVPHSAKNALMRLKKDDIPVVITTGRVFYGARKKIRQMGINLSRKDFVITEQGTVITDGEGKILYKKTMTLEDANAVIRAAEDYIKDSKDKNFCLIVYIDGIPYVKTGEESADTIGALYKTNSYDELIQKKGLPTKMILYKKDSKKPSDMNGMKTYFEQKLQGKNLNLFVTKEDFCEITDGDTSKGEAAKKVAEIMGTSLDHAACLGDAENDLAMIDIINDAGGVSVAMGNALLPVKMKAKYITGHIKEDGYKKAIDIILENNRRLKNDIIK